MSVSRSCCNVRPRESATSAAGPTTAIRAEWPQRRHALHCSMSWNGLAHGERRLPRCRAVRSPMSSPSSAAEKTSLRPSPTSCSVRSSRTESAHTVARTRRRAAIRSSQRPTTSGDRRSRCSCLLMDAFMRIAPMLLVASERLVLLGEELVSGRVRHAQALAKDLRRAAASRRQAADCVHPLDAFRLAEGALWTLGRGAQ